MVGDRSSKYIKKQKKDRKKETQEKEAYDSSPSKGTRKRRPIALSNEAIERQQKRQKKVEETLASGERITDRGDIMGAVARAAERALSLELGGQNSKPEDIKSIKFEHIEHALNYLKIRHDQIEEKVVKPDEREQQKEEERFLREAMHRLAYLKKEIASSEVNLEEFRNVISGQNRSNMLSTSSSDSSYPKEAMDRIIDDVINDIKTAEQTGVTAQQTPEPLERAKSPTPEAGPSQLQVPTFKITFADEYADE